MDKTEKEQAFWTLVRGSITQFKEVSKVEIAEDFVDLLTDIIFNNIKTAVNGKED